MTDVVISQQRKFNMSRISGFAAALKMIVRHVLQAHGLRFPV